MKKQNEPASAPAPDQRPLTKSQAARLAAVSGIDAAHLDGLLVSQINDKFRWRIDPEILFFRRICGKVVKRDPATGVEYPVPFATVHVEDTDCSFLGFFPVEYPWAWFFPFFCTREDIGTATTDGCGRFCVWVPRFEIDWILRFRRERICFPDIFLKPSILEILKSLEENPVIVRPHGPDPDPAPSLLKGGPELLRRAQELLGREVADRLASIEAGATLGASTRERQQFLANRAFPHQFPPPIPSEFKQGASRSSNIATSS